LRAYSTHPVKGCKTRLPFAALPHALVDDQRLTATMVRLAAVLLRYARGKPECWPSVATLALDLGRCRRTAQLCLRGLEAAGWLATCPADNPTGRVLLLVWRLDQGESRCAPGAQAIAPTPARVVAPESENGKTKEKPVGSPIEGRPPASRKVENPPALAKPMTAEEARQHYATWLEREPSDPLRRLAEARIHELVTGGRQAASDATLWSAAASAGSSARIMAPRASQAVRRPSGVIPLRYSTVNL
jgi:Helix-turn-helix domain